MRRLMVLALLMSTAPLRAQQVFHSEVAINLRRGPSNHFKLIRKLTPDDDMLITGDSSDTGWVPVLTLDGDSGWVGRSYLVASPNGTITTGAGTSVTVSGLSIASLNHPLAAISDSWDHPAPASSTISMTNGSCGAGGTSGSDAATNRRKNRNDEPTSSHAVRFAALRDLPYPPHLSNTRANWTTAQAADVARVEGAALTVTGFFAVIKPQRGNSESTNCGNTQEADTDWHVAMVEHETDGEPEAVVVEPTPRFKRRHPRWTTSVLAPWTGPNLGSTDSVRVTGWLFYDPSHANHIGTFRATMWELHPVTRIEVFRNGHWVNVDDL